MTLHASARAGHVATMIATVAAIATIAAAAAIAAPAASATPAVSPSKVAATLPLIEPQVMCVTCKIPLNTAKSPQANLERAYIEELIAKGMNEAQIKKALVAQYGPAVLSLPSTNGFNIAAYAVPVGVVLTLLILLVLLLPRWRAAARASEGALPTPSPLAAADAERLRRDMERFG